MMAFLAGFHQDSETNQFFAGGIKFFVQIKQLCRYHYSNVECIHEDMDFTHHQFAYRERHCPNAGMA